MLISLIYYARIMRAVKVPKWPWLNIVLKVGAIALGVFILFQGAGWIIVLVVDMLIAGGILFLILLLVSGLPKVNPAVEVGKPYVDFTARDTEGRPFTLSTLEGKPIVLKFYRGFW
jgi:hypothetical protein